MAPEQTLSDDDFADLDSLIADLLELRAMSEMIDADLPSLPDLARGDGHLLAVLEVRLERVRALADVRGEA